MGVHEEQEREGGKWIWNVIHLKYDIQDHLNKWKIIWMIDQSFEWLVNHLND